ncbi:MAG TPA: PEP-utilizing enzyme [Solirubrobacteraceae bacterium]|nr:PEP-utilizing enzyme [Solirubrobacteraceae bacterium]
MTTDAPAGYMFAGTGQNVFEHEPVEGPTRWLDSPQDVMAFVTSGDVSDAIVISRAGTTTFMAPALTVGVRGLITLNGGPESHLGIVSREFGIPCVMSVSFADGIQTDRGETIPADGTIVRLETDRSPMANVFVKDA